MNSSQFPGVVAVYRTTFHVRDNLSLSGLRTVEEITLKAFRQSFRKLPSEIHLTSSLKLGSVVIDVSLWVGGVVSFLKVYPSAKKGLVMLINDVKHLIGKMLSEGFERSSEGLDGSPEVDLISVVEKLPNKAEVLILGLDLYQVYTLSNAEKASVKDLKYIATKQWAVSSTLSINFDGVFCQLLRGDLKGIEEASKLLQKFGDDYMAIFELGIQLMNLDNAIRVYYRTHEYWMLERVIHQVISHIGKANLDDDLMDEVKSIHEKLDHLLRESPEVFQNQRQSLTDKIIQKFIERLKHS